MQQVTLQAQKRNLTSKGSSRQLRMIKSIPGIVYGNQSDSMPIQVNLRDLHGILRSSAGENVIIELEIKSGNEPIKQPVIVKELQTDPLSREFIHVDFYRISLDKELTTQVPIVALGIPVGVQDGGILEFSAREVSVRCLPTLIPDKIEVDVAALKIGHTIHISDLKVPEGAALTDAPDGVVMTVVAPKAVVEETVAPTEVTEPELITKKLTEEELLDQTETKEKEAKAGAKEKEAKAEPKEKEKKK